MSFRTQVALVFSGLCLLACGTALAAGASLPWLHVEVREDGGKGAHVNVQVPLSLARLALDLVGDESPIQGGMLKIEGADIKVAQLRQIWEQLKGAGEAQFVSVVDKDADVKVARKGEFLVVDVHDKSGDKENVLVSVPTDVVDALLSGEGDELNLDAALARLGERPAGDLVRVKGKDNVRIWIE